MSWVYEEFVMLVLEWIGGIGDALTGAVTDCFNINTEMFLAYIPLFVTAQPIIKAMGIGIAFFILLVCLLMLLFAPVYEHTENPIILVARFFLAVFCAYNGNSLVQIEFDFFKTFESNLMGLEDPAFTAGTWTDLGQRGVDYFTAGDGIAAALVTIFLIIAILINYIKIIIETAERYIVSNFCMYFSPLAGACIVSESTIKIFLSYLKLAFSQLLLLCINVLFLRGTVNLIANASAGDDAEFWGTGAAGVWVDSAGTSHGNMFILILFILAFLKTGQQIDTYMKSLGLTVAQTGGSLFDEMRGAAMMFRGSGRMIGKGLRAGGGLADRVINAGSYDRGNTGFRGAMDHVFGSKNPAGHTSLDANGINSSIASQAGGGLDGKQAATGIRNGVISPENLEKNGAEILSAGYSALNNIPNMSGARVGQDRNGYTIARAGTGTATLSTNAPTTGAYRQIMGEDGLPMYMSSKGDGQILGKMGAMNQAQMAESLGLANTNALAGTSAMALANTISNATGLSQAEANNLVYGNLNNNDFALSGKEAFGVQWDNTKGELASALADAKGISNEAAQGLVEDATFENMGNNMMQMRSQTLLDDEGNLVGGEVLGTIAAPGAGTEIEPGIGTTIGGTGTDLDQYDFIPAPDEFGIDDDYSLENKMFTNTETGECYDANAINIATGADDMILDREFYSDGSMAVTTSTGSSITLSADEMASYKLDDTTGYIEAQNFGRIMSSNEIQNMMNSMYPGMDTPVGIQEVQITSTGDLKMQLSNDQWVRTAPSHLFASTDNSPHISMNGGYYSVHTCNEDGQFKKSRTVISRFTNDGKGNYNRRGKYR